MFIILIFTAALVGWSLHLMRQALVSREFSLMLAGLLVALAASALMGIYHLIGNYVGYMTGPQHLNSWIEQSASIERSYPWASEIPMELDQF